MERRYRTYNDKVLEYLSRSTTGRRNAVVFLNIENDGILLGWSVEIQLIRCIILGTLKFAKSNDSFV